MNSTINVTALKRHIQRKALSVSKAMADELKQVIIDNSKSSKDILGRKLKKYTPKYQAWRKAHGFSETPDLRRSGKMLDDQVSGISSGVAHLHPDAANRGKAEGNQAKRKFYPENDSDIKGSTLKRLIRAGERAFAA